MRKMRKPRQPQPSAVLHCDLVQAGRSPPNIIGVEAGDRDSGLRLAELVAAFSLATDLGLGQPMEHVLRSWQIAARLGEPLGMKAEAREALFFVTVLAWVGCVADSGGRGLVRRRHRVPRGQLRRRPGWVGRVRVLASATPGEAASALHRLRPRRPVLVLTGGRRSPRAPVALPDHDSALADRLGLGADVCDPLRQVFTRWDGKGVPPGSAARTSRSRAAVPPRRRRRGVTTGPAGVDGGSARWRGPAAARQFAPDVVDSFCEIARRGAADLADHGRPGRAVVSEPHLQHRLSASGVGCRARGLADFTDLRSRLSGRPLAGRRRPGGRGGPAPCGLPPGREVVTAVAGRDWSTTSGCTAYPSRSSTRPGRCRRPSGSGCGCSTYYTERVLARPAGLARIGAVAALGARAHGRSAGTTVGCRAGDPAKRPHLGRGCAYRAMIEPRPHRPAMSAKQAAAQLRREVRAGRLDADAVDAVLAATGQHDQAALGSGRAHPPRGRGPDPDRPRCIHPAGRPHPGHHGQDRRDPHRADLHQDRRLDPVDRNAVRPAAWPAGQP